MLDSRSGAPNAPSRADRAASRTWSTISPVGQVPLESALTGGAERAGHAATGLRGDAERDPVRVLHQHRLDQRAVVCPPQRLAGVAVVGLEAAHLRQQLREQRIDQLLPRTGGQVGHLVGIAGQAAEVVPGQLIGPERGLTEVDHRQFAGRDVEVGPGGPGACRDGGRRRPTGGRDGRPGHSRRVRHPGR